MDSIRYYFPRVWKFTRKLSLQGWLNDIISATNYLVQEQHLDSVYAAGFGTGGAMAINAASKCKTLAGVAAVSPPSDFNDWVAEPEDLLNYAREVGVISDPQFPTDLEGWTNELSLMQTIEAAEAMGEKRYFSCMDPMIELFPHLMPECLQMLMDPQIFE